MPYTLPFTFYNLKKLQLCVDFNEIHSILSMFTMLRSCHNLQNLKIEVMLDVAFGISLLHFLKSHLVVYN
jgi:hypothetical protein